MPKYIAKLKDLYFEWSTVVDAPVTYGMSLEQFKRYYQEQYGLSEMAGLNARFTRVEVYGVSAWNVRSVDELLAGNRAGLEESELGVDEIYALLKSPDGIGVVDEQDKAT